MDKIEVKTLNEDGSVSFSGSLNKDQAGFILGIGINYLLAQGASIFVDDEDEEDLPEPNAPTSSSMQ